MQMVYKTRLSTAGSKPLQLAPRQADPSGLAESDSHGSALAGAPKSSTGSSETLPERYGPLGFCASARAARQPQSESGHQQRIRDVGPQAGERSSGGMTSISQPST